MSTNDNSSSRLSMELGIVKFEAESTDKQWIEQMANKFFPPAVEVVTKRLARRSKQENPQQKSLFDVSGASRILADDSAPTTNQNDSVNGFRHSDNGSAEDHTSLGEFYHTLHISSQSDGISAIAYWFQHIQNVKPLTREYFESGYVELKLEGVKKPDAKGLRMRIDNAVRDGYLVSVERGEYVLARKGKERVEGMLQAQDKQ